MKRSVVAISNTWSILIASNGQTSTQIWQLMQTDGVDVEDRGVELQLAGGVGLLVLALLDVDALRRAFLLADLAGDAAQRAHRVGGVLGDEEGEVAVVLRQDGALLGILDRDQPRRVVEAAHEVFRGDGETFDDAGAEHGFLLDGEGEWRSGAGNQKKDQLQLRSAWSNLFGF